MPVPFICQHAAQQHRTIALPVIPIVEEHAVPIYAHTGWTCNLDELGYVSTRVVIVQLVDEEGAHRLFRTDKGLEKC